jgi:carboxymethylenebutenolidase
VDARDVSVPLPAAEQLPVELALPDRGQGPGVLLICDIFGRTPFYRHLTRRLADAGYTALLPDIFFREGELSEVTREAAFARREQLDEARALRDLHTAAEWLERHEAVGGARLGLLGFCLGGTLALDMCAERDGFAAACYYAFPSGLPRSNAPAPLDVVDRIRGPVLAFWGDQDYIDMDEVARLGDAMAHHNKDYDAHLYPGVGHGFLRGLVEGGDDHEAARDSWERTLLFFAQHLPAEAVTT